MHVLRVCKDSDGKEPLGQLCEASRTKRLLWCAKGTSNAIADTADYNLAMTLASAYVNEPADLTRYLRKVGAPPGQYYVVLWNVGRHGPDAALEFELE